MILPAPAIAQDLVQLTGDVIEEAEHDRTPISKPGWLRGLHIVGSTPLSQPRPSIIATLPGKLEKFCGRITSLGGDYSATVQFTPKTVADEDQGGLLDFEARSDFPLGATHNDSGVVLEFGECFDDRLIPGAPRKFIANFWNVANQPEIDANGNLQIVMNMNVARAERLDTQAWIGDREAPRHKLDVTCRKLTDPKALAFNYQCVIALPASLADETVTTPVGFEYRRFYRGRLSDPRQAEILIGPILQTAGGANQ